jgi:hypothetical protein
MASDQAIPDESLDVASHSFNPEPGTAVKSGGLTADARLDAPALTAPATWSMLPASTFVDVARPLSGGNTLGIAGSGLSDLSSSATDSSA